MNNESKKIVHQDDFDELREKHNKKVNDFKKYRKEIDKKLDKIEYILYGADQSFGNEIYQRKDLRDNFISDLVSCIDDSEISENQKIFYSIFFDTCIQFIGDCDLQNDFIYSSFIIMAKTIDRGEDGNEESIFDIMIESEQERDKESLKKEFYDSYSKMMSLYPECYTQDFDDIIRQGIYRYLEYNEIAYEYPEKYESIEEGLKQVEKSLSKIAFNIHIHRRIGRRQKEVLDDE